MTFETLMYIHSLMKQDEADLKADYKATQDYLEELKDKGASREELEKAKRHMEAADHAHIKALTALNEFNDHEWR